MIVDDNLINIEVLLSYLESNDLKVSVATSGERAIKQCQHDNKPSLILLDVMMPDMDGFETCRRLKADAATAHIPIIFMTALSDTTDKVRGFEIGGVDYIIKPFQQEEVLMRVKTHLTLQQLQREVTQINQTLEKQVAQRTAELRQANQWLKVINKAYSRFVPEQFLKLLGHDDIVQVKLGDYQACVMTILFSDVRAFTQRSSQMIPEDTFKFINAYFKRVGPIIRKRSGVIDKYVGDAIMAIFPNQADDAILAAIDTLKILHSYNQTRQRPERDPIEIGIGLHTGLVTCGVVGEAQRLDTTIISDAVNLASRVQNLNKLYGTDLIVTGQTMKALRDPKKYHWRTLDHVVVQGRTEPTIICEIIDGLPPEIRQSKIETKRLFEQGVALYRQQEFAKAQTLFEQTLTRNPDDRAAQLYLERIADLRATNLPPDWSGVAVLPDK